MEVSTRRPNFLISAFPAQTAQRLADAGGRCQRLARPVRTAEMKQQRGTKGARLAWHVPVQTAITPEQVGVSDFHVDPVQFFELVHNLLAIEITLPDGFVDDVRENKTPERALVEQTH